MLFTHETAAEVIRGLRRRLLDSSSDLNPEAVAPDGTTPLPPPTPRRLFITNHRHLARIPLLLLTY